MSNGLPYISEHESAVSSGEGSEGYNPSQEERDRIRLVDSLYSKAKKYRKRSDSKWQDYYRMFRGRQWKETRPSYRNSEVLNLVFQTIESMIPILTDSRPQLEYLPTVPEQFELAQILTKVAENDWDNNNWLMILCEVLLDGHLYGTGIGYCGYDADANLGLGNITFESREVFHQFPDPNARDINEKRCRWYIEAEPVDIGIIKKQYPDKACYLSPDVVDLSQADKADIYQVMFKSPTDSRIAAETSGDSVDRNQVLKLTLYMHDDEIEELEREELGEDGTPALDDMGAPKKTFVQQMKYPRGRKTVIAGGVLLEDGPMEFEDGQIPFIKFTNYILPREFWGMSEVEQLEGPQKTINKLLSFTLDVMTLMGNPIWVVDPTKSGIDTDNLFNKPGLIVETDDMTAVRREEGVNLQPFVLQILDRYKQYFDGISGQTDISRGSTSSQVSAASAIESLQQAQQTRLRMKSRNLDAFIQQFGKMYLSRVFQYYSVPRIIRASGDKDAQNYFYFHVEKLDADPNTGEPFVNAETMQPEVKLFANVTHANGVNRRVEIIGDFDVKVSTGSSLPFAKETKTNLSMNLFKLGVIDDEELLKNIDYPNYQAVVQRMNEKKQAAAAEQMQAQAMQAQAQAQAKAQAAPPPSAPPPGA